MKKHTTKTTNNPNNESWAQRLHLIKSISKNTIFVSMVDHCFKKIKKYHSKKKYI